MGLKKEQIAEIRADILYFLYGTITGKTDTLQKSISATNYLNIPVKKSILD